MAYQSPDRSQPRPVSGDPVLAIHHIADPHYSRFLTNNALSAYSQYLFQPDKQRPHIVIVSGDLTLTGSTDELREVANLLANLYRSDPLVPLNQSVFVVPGPHDIDWSRNHSSGTSLDIFADLFQRFCIPAYVGRDGQVLHSQPYAISDHNHYLVYTLNTCLVPETLPKPVPKKLEELISAYRAIWRELAKSTNKPNPLTTANVQLYNDFMAKTERLIRLDAGAIPQSAIEHFNQQMQKLGDLQFGISQPGFDAVDPLRILVTHHPLISFASGSDLFPSATNAGQMLRAARLHNFQIVLHGHTHESHVLSDLIISKAMVSDDRPVLQIGAGLLGATERDNRSPRVFNELIARYDRASDNWSVDLNVVRLGEESMRTPLHFVVLSARQSGMRNVAPSQRSDGQVDAHEFDRRLRYVLLRFNENLVSRDPSMTNIVSDPLHMIEGIIKDVIFSGWTIRTGLALKEAPAVPGAPVILRNTYIDPGPERDLQYIHPFSYPVTLGSWALILGEPFIYPTDFDTPKNQIQVDRLDPQRLMQIEDLLVRRSQNPASTPEDRAHAQRIYNGLQNKSLTLRDVFLKWPDPEKVGGTTLYTSFIAMPVPLRSAPYSDDSLPEIGVLHVDVQDAPGAKVGAAFTEERVGMLKMLSSVIVTILLIADTQRRPKGSWSPAPFY
jgi:3',5'-cyclic AMP phosphodiesterase CpdA